MLASSRLILFLVLLFGSGLQLIAQSFQPYFRQYSTEDGLPSSEVHFVLEDRQGFLWFATDNGVARFDGYEFDVYDSEDGLEDVVIFKIREDALGRVWIATYSGRLYYFENEQFFPFEHNDKLAELKEKTQILSFLEVNLDEGLIFAVLYKGLVQINWEGEISWLTPESNRDGGIYFYRFNQDQDRPCRQSRDAIFYTQRKKSVESTTKLMRYEISSGAWQTYGHIKEEGYVPHVQVLDSVGQDMLVFSGNHLWYIKDAEAKKQWEANYSQVNYSFPHHDKGYLICINYGGGVEYLNSEDEVQLSRDTLLEGHSVSHGIYDRDGGLWFTTIDAGVFYAANPNTDIFNSTQGLPAVKALSVTLASDTAFYVGYDNSSVYYCNPQKAFTSQIPLPDYITNFQVSSLFYDQKRNTLYTNQFLIKPRPGRLNEVDQIKPHVHPFTNSGIPIRQLYMPNGSLEEKLFVTSGHYFGTYNLLTQKIDRLFNSLDKEDARRVFHIFHEDYQGRFWVGTLHGLFQYFPDQDSIHANNLGIPALSNRVEEIRNLPNGALLFGTRGTGLIYYAADTTYTISTSNGLASDMIRDIEVTDNGLVWVATLTGLSRIHFDPNGVIEDLRTFQIPHGLPSNEIHDVESYNQQVWLATSRGIIHFRPPKEEAADSQPLFRKLLVNGEIRKLTDFQNLRSKENNLEITFRDIDYRMAAKINYRYRLRQGLPWQFTDKSTVNYPDLSFGNFKFEVQSQNLDGDWSKSSFLPIFISAPWYLRWYTLVLFSMAAGTIFFLIIQQREQRRKKDQAYTLQIDRLERAALHAQMNPHFIFNTLNSIQSYILRNDKKAAVIYLSQFAQLIRDTLRVSANGNHSLSNELNILRNYLSLEKLRFKKGFDYKIKLAKGLIADQIFLPPLLIQPFVENAIKHGLKDQEEGGYVEIDFSGTAEELSVRVFDNGVGFDPNANPKGDSMGMTITRRRLELMNAKSKLEPSMKIIPHFDEDGKAAGTEIIILIRTLDPSKPLEIEA